MGPCTDVLARLQKGLEELYRVETELQVDDFVIDEDTRDQFGPARSPREQLLVAQDGGYLQLGLFISKDALANLEVHDPASLLDDRNLDDFLLTLEGVSHFVYLAWRARADHSVSALELELQAEIDKYVTCLLVMEQDAGVPGGLPGLLFAGVEFADDLDDHEAERYRVANECAHAYTRSLHRRFARTGRLHDMLPEVRRFYRLSLAGKLDWARRSC
jgi:hypothetical protein